MSLVDRISASIKAQFEADSSGHDWFHIQRVLNISRFLQSKEGGDLIVIELAALLHDISDYKLNGGKLNEGGVVATQIMKEFEVDTQVIDQVVYIIDNISYKGANTPTEMRSLEGMIVQDADRLDAIGAIGIGRTFAYGGHKGQAMYDPTLSTKMHSSFEEYATSKSSTINHFYEKLLLLTDRLNTTTAKEIGRRRHEFMQQFVDEFMMEWNFNSKASNE